MPVENIILLPVTSSIIQAVGYSEAHKVLRVRFQNTATKQATATWDYAGVTKLEHESLMKSRSVGTFFGRSIKGCHTGTKVEENADLELEAQPPAKAMVTLSQQVKDIKCSLTPEASLLIETRLSELALVTEVKTRQAFDDTMIQRGIARDLRLTLKAEKTAIKTPVNDLAKKIEATYGAIGLIEEEETRLEDLCNTFAKEENAKAAEAAKLKEDSDRVRSVELQTLQAKRQTLETKRVEVDLFAEGPAPAVNITQELAETTLAAARIEEEIAEPSAVRGVKAKAKMKFVVNGLSEKAEQENLLRLANFRLGFVKLTIRKSVVQSAIDAGLIDEAPGITIDVVHETNARRIHSTNNLTLPSK